MSWEHRPIWLCITNLDPRPKGFNAGHQKDYHDSTADLEQMRKYKEATRMTASCPGISYIYADGMPITQDNCLEIMTIRWNHLTGILRDSAPTVIKGRTIEIRLDGLLQAKAEREARKAQPKPEVVRTKSPGRPPLSKEQHQASYNRRQAMDRERHGYTGPMTPEEKRAKEARKKRLQYLRKKSLT
jgi:hypothetical protein